MGADFFSGGKYGSNFGNFELRSRARRSNFWSQGGNIPPSSPPTPIAACNVGYIYRRKQDFGSFEEVHLHAFEIPGN